MVATEGNKRDPLSAFKSIGRNVKRSFSSAVSGGRGVVKKIGDFARKNEETIRKVGRYALIGTNIVSGLISSPIGTGIVYGLGALGGPAGLAVANGVVTGARAVYLGTSVALGGQSIIEGADILRGTKKGEYKEVGKGLGLMALGAFSLAGTGIPTFTKPATGGLAGWGKVAGKTIANSEGGFGKSLAGALNPNSSKNLALYEGGYETTRRLNQLMDSNLVKGASKLGGKIGEKADDVFGRFTLGENLGGKYDKLSQDLLNSKLAKGLNINKVGSYVKAPNIKAGGSFTAKRFQPIKLSERIENRFSTLPTLRDPTRYRLLEPQVSKFSQLSSKGVNKLSSLGSSVGNKVGSVGNKFKRIEREPAYLEGITNELIEQAGNAPLS